VADLSVTLPSFASPRRAGSRDVLPWLVMAAFAIGLANRLLAGLDVPLWLDENFSAEIASQTSLHGLVAWCLNELSGPVYYMTLFLWEKLAGNGNVALRLPSLVFSIAAPLLILWRGHPDRQVRLLWAGITALCLNGVDSATEARPYALLFLLGCGQAILFMRMIREPRRRTALAWTTVSVLMVLTHYHSAVLCGLQGMAYLALCRERAVRTWPALAPLVPMTVWMIFHLPFILRYANADTVWYNLLQPDALWLVPALLMGVAWPGVVLLATMAVTLGLDARAAATGKAPWPYSAPETAVAGSGMLAFAVVMGMGFVFPSFTPRYLLPFMPAVLLGVALWAHRTMRQAPYAGGLLLCMMLGSSTGQLIERVRHPQADYRYSFNLETPSRWFAQRGVTRMVFLWDYPAASLIEPARMAAVGSFFLRRDGHRVETIVPPWPRAGEDPNRILIDRAGTDRHSAILWAYDTHIAGTRGILFPGRIPQIDPRWQCRNFGAGANSVLGCVRR
jgi:hypothetical protein